jgi:Ca2+-binding EF-hand superfamily protein
MAYEVPEALIQRKSPREQLREKNSRQIQRSLRELQHETHFGKLEIEDLYAKYVTKLGQGNQMTPDIFKSAIAELMDVDITENEELVERYYKFFDTDSNGNVSFVEFVTGASVLLKGTALEKIKRMLFYSILTF